MRLLSALLISTLSYHCADSSFTGSGTTALPLPTPIQSENVETAALEKLENNTQVTESGESKECLLAVGGDAQSIISISEGNIDLSQITPNSVLYLKVQGQADIDLSAADISSLKGICIEATGKAAVTIDLNATVSAMFYYARGTSMTTLDFKQSGILQKLITNISGTSRLSLVGETIACQAIAIQQNGASNVDCNGDSI